MYDGFFHARLFATLGLVLLVSCSSSSDNGGGQGGTGGTSGTGGAGGRGGSGATGGSTGGSTAGSGGATGGSGGSTAGTGGATGGAGGSGGAAGGSGGSTGGSGGATGGSGGSTGGMSGDTRGGGAESGGSAKMAVANLMPFSTGTIMGTVTFVEVTGGVQVTYMLQNCPAGAHPTHIHAGTGCGSEAAQGMHWNGARGENIGPNGGEITCGADMRGMLVYTRMSNSAATRWTIGDGSATDIIGHPVVVHGVMDSNARHGCGVIQAK